MHAEHQEIVFSAIETVLTRQLSAFACSTPSHNTILDIMYLVKITVACGDESRGMDLIVSSIRLDTSLNATANTLLTINFQRRRATPLAECGA